MKITFDTEFIDDGKTIELLSIGMVAENGDELYKIIDDADWGRALEWGDGWLYQNVIKKHLPVIATPGDWGIDRDHPDYRHLQPRWAVADAVENFLFRHGGPDPSKLPELWADYPATDHVALYQLFGPMIECTSHGVPMRTSCLTQEEESQARQARQRYLSGTFDKMWAEAMKTKPVQAEATKHHALHDARHDMDLARWLKVVT